MKLKLRLKPDSMAVFLLGAICVCLLSPYVAQTIGDIPIFAITLVFLLLEINPLLHCSVAERNTVITILIYLLIVFINKFLGRSTASVSMHFNLVKFFIPFVCMLPIYRRLTRKQMLFLVIVVLGTVLFTMIHNFSLKAVWRTSFSQRLYKLRGVKGAVTTAYTGAIMLISGALLSVFLQKNRLVIRALAFAGAVLCFYFNLNVTQRGIALILTLIMIPLLILYNGQRTRRRVIRTALAILLLLFAVLNYEAILGLIADLLRSDRLTRRINSIIDLIEAGGLEDTEGGSLTARIRLIGVSIRTFWSSLPNFLIGVGMKTDTDTVIGNHSQFFDEFAKFGIFVALLCIRNVLRMLKATRVFSRTEKGSGEYYQMSVIIFVFILRAFVGGILDASIGAVMFVGIPLIFLL